MCFRSDPTSSIGGSGPEREELDGLQVPRRESGDGHESKEGPGVPDGQGM